MKSYKDLKVWQNAMALAERIYAVTEHFPAVERYGLTQQIRKAALSIPSNIAEGYGRRSLKHRLNFLEYALGSVFEVETQAELSTRVGFLSGEDSAAIAEQTRGLGRGLSALIDYVEKELAAENPPAKNSPEELRGTPRNPRN